VISDGTVGADSGATQIVGALVLAIVMFGIAYGFFRVQDALTKGGIRPTEEDELVGLDLPEMGVLAYPDLLGHGGVPSTDGAPAPARLPEEVG
jgi:ammonia channel protein AmtB